MNKAQLINQDSGKVEYYTPSWIVEAAREVMGSIDLDPASSEKANEIVKAKFYCANIQDTCVGNSDGLSARWFGNVWMNHPFSRINNVLWIGKLIKEYTSWHINQACCITYASTSEGWFQPLMNYPQCFFIGRVNYIDGFSMLPTKDVSKGSVVTYLGPNIQKFYEVFSHYGNVMFPYRFIEGNKNAY